MILRKNATASAILAGFALFALSALAPPAMACGDLQGWIEKYQSPEASDASRQTALRKLAGPCKGYIAVTSDELLLEVLHDALRRQYDKASVQVPCYTAERNGGFCNLDDFGAFQSRAGATDSFTGPI